MAQQSFENHTKIVPGFLVAGGVLVANVLWNLYRTVVAFSMTQLWALAVAIAIMVVASFARTFALTVQDRVIRLEMQVRLARLAPDLAARFGEFTVGQLCSLRFAGDGELPELARRVLSEKLDDRKAIKKQIRDWQADHLRA